MGGGHVTRPGFGPATPDASHPLTEFYLLLQQALQQQGRFALPGLWARLQAPARRIYADELLEFASLASQPREGYQQLAAPTVLRLGYCSLQLAADGAPAALLLAAEGSRQSCAVQLAPPFLPFMYEQGLPPLPQAAMALQLQLTDADLALADTGSAALGRQLASRTEGKRWLYHPRYQRWQAETLALLQRMYR